MLNLTKNTETDKMNHLEKAIVIHMKSLRDVDLEDYPSGDLGRLDCAIDQLRDCLFEVVLDDIDLNWSSDDK